ncbi:sugar ABC transporter substrate-binding protein [Vallitalea pronyensis]|uniref:Sugar ABC transporter substrate-binding protein n=1 Tax=Vallitalea pronyensis TaxID=1348613 RepID=A0A8J8SJF8_9FIRM|nr:sugar ABC transporter substrate-binding protein [Vallitalea pronyensis]QUI25437.1 sugar ABC transporter substrate-binding protein [Vallitalea pronyensis]
MKKVVATILVVMLFVAVMGGCSKKETKKTIGISVDQLFESRVGVIDAAKAELDKNGYSYIEVVADGDPQTQNAQIQSLINQKVDAILVCAVDQNTIETALLAAKKAKIPVVAYDRDLPESEAIDSFVGPDSIADGVEAGTYMAEQLKDENGKVVVLELLGALNDQNGIDRSKGFNEAMAALAHVEIVAMPTDWDSAKALSATQNAFQANPDIKAIFAATDTQIPSIETVLTDLGKMNKVGEEGHVIVCGINGSNDGYEATANGIADGIVVMDLKTTGETAAQHAIALIKGEEIEEKVVIPGIFYTTENIEANKDTIWGAK